VVFRLPLGSTFNPTRILQCKSCRL